MGGDFNLITSLRENKRGRRVLDKYQEAFRDFLTQSPFIDLETGDGWFTLNNKCGGEYLVASRIDIFLVSENLMRGTGKIVSNVLPTAGSDH